MPARYPRDLAPAAKACNDRQVRLVVLVLLAGCRLGFDELRTAPDAPGDAAPVACPQHPCSAPGIYRSVGPGNVSALVRSTPLAPNTLVIAGTTATFSTPLPDQVGLGDVIEYDSDGDDNVDALAFITERVSSTEYFVAAELGGPPAAGTSTRWAMFRAYTSLASAMIGETNPAVAKAFDGWGIAPHDVAALGVPWHVACYADAIDNRIVRLDNWITSATAFVRIFTPRESYEVGISQRHAGRWSDAAYSLQPPSTTIDLAISIGDAFARIEGLQIFVDSDDSPGDLPYAIDLHGTAAFEFHVSESILRGNNTPTPNTSIQRGIKVDASNSARQTLYAYNNVIYDLGGGLDVRGIESTGNGSTIYSYNNTFVNLHPAILGNDPSDIAIIRNTLAIACASPCLGGVGTISGSNNVGFEFDDYAIGVAPASDAIADYFVGGDDFHLGAGPGAGELVDRGADLSADPELPFAHDIDRAPRTAAWDIGADER